VSRSGRRGPAGGTGLRGAKGEKGAKGDSPEIIGRHLDRKTYRAFPVLADGKLGPELNLRPLFVGRLRKFQLMQHPLCKFCLQRGIVTRTNVVDHVVPHKGDWTEFVTGELQSLCEPCHKSAKRQIELRGYRCDVGISGYLTDPNHPFNRAR
jgi:hypothetical protein